MRLTWKLNRTQRKHKICVGTYKKQGTHKCCVGTNGNRKENTRVAWKPTENAKKTNVLLWNQWKTKGKHMCCVGTY